jgi:hypothetical protein
VKKLALAIVVFSMSLFGCTTAEQASAVDALAKLQTAVANGCMVIQPTLTAAAALDPVLATSATANGLFCTAASGVSVASVQSLIGTGIPQIEQAVMASTLVPDDKKPLIVAALGIFQLTVTNAFAVYGQTVVKTSS